ncbi:hypothetical protein [Pedobacter sp. NJ-S-72]
MDTEQFRALIAKYNNNTATTEERALVEHWYERLHKEEVLPEAANLKEQLYSRVKEQIGENQPAPVRTTKSGRLYPSMDCCGCNSLCII